MPKGIHIQSIPENPEEDVDTFLPSIKDLTEEELELNQLRRVSSCSGTRSTISMSSMLEDPECLPDAPELPLPEIKPSNEYISRYGCPLDSQYASCKTHKMSAYNKEDIQEIASKEQRRNRDKNPELEFARIEFSTTMAAYEKSQLGWDVAEKGPFCCEQLEYDERSSALLVPDKRIASIQAFMATVKANTETGILYCPNELTVDEMSKINNVIRVNPIQNLDECLTFLYTPHGDYGFEYLGFMYIDPVHKFETIGENAYLAYFCKQHKMKYRVGSFSIKWSKDAMTWATTGDARFDQALQLPIKIKFDPLKYGRMGALERQC